jgi:hypothetical protein
VQDNITSTNNTHTPTKIGGRGENNIIQDISDRVQTVHTAQNASLLTVRKVQEGGAIEQCQAQEIISTEFDLCSRKTMSEQEHKKICGPGDIFMAGTYKENIHQNNVQIPNICQEYAHQEGDGDGQPHGGDGQVAGGGGGHGYDGQGEGSHFGRSGESGEEQVDISRGGEQQLRQEQVLEQDQGVQDRPVGGTCHQEGGGGGGGVREQRVGDDGGAVKPSRRSVGWVVPRRRRGVVPDGITQSRLQNFVVVGKSSGGCKKSGKTNRVITASCQSGSGINSYSGKKRRYCEIEDRETGGQPSKTQKRNLLPGI